MRHAHLRSSRTFAATTASIFCAFVMLMTFQRGAAAEMLRDFVRPTGKLAIGHAGALLPTNGHRLRVPRAANADLVGARWMANSNGFGEPRK